MNETLLLERYKILEPLGEGGFSKVVKAVDTKVDRVVAIKIIPAGRQAAVRALREAKTVALLNHPNIVTLYEFEQRDGNYYLIMEFVEGQNLATILDKFGRLPVELVAAIAVQVCEALECAHQNDVIHRDIKPANLRILSDGRVKVMDFGIARLRSAAKTSGVTAENDIVGTFAYMSPEQASGETADERSDLFSLGVLLYRMVTGGLPFSADTPAGTIYKILNEEPGQPHEVDELISPILSQIITTAIAKSPDDRFPTIEELKTRLQRCSRSSDPPAMIVKEMLGELREAQRAGVPGTLESIRRQVASWLQQYQDTLITTGFAVGAALCAAWATPHLPFFSTRLNLLFPVGIFFLALFLPPAGFAALLALLAAVLWQTSPYLGVVAALISVVYWMTLGRGFPQIAILPLLAPVVAWLKAPFLFPLAVGLIFSPVLGAFLAGFGAGSLALAEIIGRLNYSWSISLRPDLISGLKFNSQFKDLSSLFGYLKSQPWILWQAGIWAAAAATMGTMRRFKTRVGRLLAVGAGWAVLSLGYKLVPPYLRMKYDFSRLFLQPMVFSLIILLVLIFIFQNPSTGLSRAPAEK